MSGQTHKGFEQSSCKKKLIQLATGLLGQNLRATSSEPRLVLWNAEHLLKNQAKIEA